MWAQGSLADRVHRGRPSKGEAWDRPLPSGTDRLAAGGREAEAGPQLHVVEDDLLIEDIEEFDLDGDDDGDGDAGNGDLQQPPGRLPLPPCGTGCPVAVAGRRLAAADARALCMLLFKHAGGEPPESWWQGFFFSQHPELPFGLVQDAGGPCGVLAAVQAHLLVVQYRVGRGFDLQLDSQQRQRQALTRAVAAAVWGARAGRSGAVWVTCSSAFGDSSGMPFRALADSLSVRDAASLSELERCVADSLPQLTARRGAGLLLLLLSVLLTRGGCDAVAADMDEPEAGLTAAHGYATLDLVNLLISGEAVSNVFDGDMELDGTVMKGVRHRGRIGMLTLFEWYRSLEVGERLKSPQLPVWLVCSESHFSVLWADDPAAALGVLPCDLHYYDGLAKQSAPIRLTLSPGDRPRSHAEFNNDQLLPPLEAVLLTKWHGAEVDWNGTEPLL